MPRNSTDDTTIRLSTRRNAVLFLGCFLFVVGVGTGRVALVATGEFFLVLLLVQWFTGADAIEKLRVRRTHYPRTFEGQEVTVDLDVENPGKRRVVLLEATDSFPPSGEYFVRHMAVDLPAGMAVPFRYRQLVSRRRGLYILGPVKLRARDPLGLYTFRTTADELTRLLIYPTAEPLRGFEVLRGGTHMNIGREVVRRIGRSEEFERLRSYRPGDPPRLIHWPSTARMREPVVKEFERNVVTEVLIYCDLYLLSLSGLGDLTSVEYRLRVAASVAAEAIRRGHMVRVVAAKNPREETRLAGGSSHLTAVLDWMALLRPDGHGAMEEDLLTDAIQMRRGSTAVLVLSSIHIDPSRLRDAVRLLKLRRVHVIAIVVEDRTFIKLRREQQDLYAQALPLESLAQLLRDLDVPVYTVSNFEDVPSRLGVSA